MAATPRNLWAAAPADAREVARLNNCTPKKIEVYNQSMGGEGSTVFRVSCTLPKLTSEAQAKGADAVLIQCSGTLCTYLRAIKMDEK